jgi:hypothetical protein
MNVDTLRDQVRRQPFEAFWVCLSDGSHHDVRHPEMIAVSRRDVAIPLGTRKGEVADRLAICDPLHIVGVEPINGRAARRRRSRRKG